MRKKRNNSFNLNKKDKDFSRSCRSLFRRALALFLAALMFAMNCDVFFKDLKFEAAELVPSLDGSKGGPVTAWFTNTDLADGRYSGYGSGYTLGAKETPYIIKTGDELAGLAELVNKGNSFSGKFIDVTGLSSADVAADSALTANTVDLRRYDGSTKSWATSPMWNPIGISESTPFSGTIYSSTNADIINFTYRYYKDDANDNSAWTCYGLFNYNYGVIGFDGDDNPRGFTLKFTEVSSGTEVVTSGGVSVEVPYPVQMDIVASSKVRTLGGVTAYNYGKIGYITVNGDFLLSDNTDTSATYKNYTVGSVAGENIGTATVTGCVYDGAVTCTQDTVTKLSGGGSIAESNNAGVGGIAGYSSGDISYCVSSADITYGTAGNYTDVVTGPYNYVGGIAGMFAGQNLNNCVYSGSISCSNSNYAPASVTSWKTCFGGIAGYVNSGKVSQCASSADIYAYYSLQDKPYTFVGGIAGYSKGIIDYSFSMGSLVSGAACGGIVGESTAAINYCYYSGSVQGMAAVTGNFSSTFDIGGIIGRQSAALNNVYFSGSTLSSNAGSIVGYSSSASLNIDGAASYYDKQISPNSFVKNYSGDRTAAEDSAAKTTEELAFIYAADSEWFISAGKYPQLAWTQTISEDSVYGKAIKILSQLSAAQTISIDSSNSFTDQSGNLNAYQMRSSKTGSDSFNSISASVNDVTVASKGGWTADQTFAGVNQSSTIGYVWKQSFDVSYEGLSLRNISIKRKLVEAVTQENLKATSIADTSSFMRFLDHSNIASASYIGGKFSLSQNIADTINVSNVFGKTADDRKRLDNVFASSLDGNGKTIASVTFSNGAESLFGSSEGGSLNNIVFDNVAIGTAAANIEGTLKLRIALFFSTAADTSVKNIAFNDVEVDIRKFGVDTANEELFTFGLITAKSSGNLYCENISVSNYLLNVGYFTRGNAENVSRAGSCGGLVGSMTLDSSDKLLNCSINNYNAFFDLYEHYNYNRPNGIGGMIGRINGNNGNSSVPVLENCSIKGDMTGNLGGGSNGNGLLFYTGGIVGVCSNSNLYFKGVSYEGTLKGASKVGGIAGSFEGGDCIISDSFVIADITCLPKAPNLANGSLAGGFIGADNSTTINNSFFMGNLQSSNAGAGFFGKVKDSKVNNSYVKAIITAKTYSAGFFATGGKATVTNSYFSGQVKGAGDKAAFMATGSLIEKNSYFDENIIGKSIPTSLKLSTDDPVKGAELDSICGVNASKITASLLGSYYTDISPEINYPQLTVFSDSGNSYHSASSDRSAKKVFLLDSSSYLTSEPNFELTDGGSVYSVDRYAVNDGSLSPWNEILNGPADGALYGSYTKKAKGNTTFTVNYGNYGSTASPELVMVYDVNVKPFDYGSGSEADPFIIYDIDELLKYRDYLANNYDTPGQYYKIGSVDAVANRIIGDPIVLDLASDDRTKADWTPIANLSGHLDGNNSLIKNISCSSGYELRDADGRLSSVYYGFFASCSSSADVKNLALDNVSINASRNGITGGFIAQGAGGSFSGISVTNLKIDASSIESDTGGFIGNVSITGSNQFTLDKCIVDAEIKGNPAARNNGGGIIGYVSGSVTGSVNNILITNTSAYGSISGFNNLGGVIGSTSCKTYIGSSVSTIDLVTTATGGYIGGVVGKSSVNNSEFTLNNVIYGGRIEASAENNSVGGIAGQITIALSSLNTADTPFPSRESVSLVSEYSRFKTNEEADAYAISQIQPHMTASYYNHDVNFVQAFGYAFSGTVHFIGSDGITPTSDHMSFSDSTDCDAVISSTCEMTSDSSFIDRSGGDWTSFEENYYPRNSWIDALQSDSAKSVWDKAYIKALSQFRTAAVYYTNADKFLDNTFSNIYFLADSLSWDKAPSGTVFSDNKKMIVSTMGGVLSDITLSMSVDGYTFSKKINYIPSVKACGIPEISWYYANRDGMWVTKKTITEEGSGGSGGESQTSVISNPWTLYTADQLAGLSLLTGGTYTDGYGNKVPDAEFAAAAKDGEKLGDTLILGRSIDMSAYPGFMPIGGNSSPFSKSFDGNGFVLENFSVGNYEYQGLFGVMNNGSVKDLGITSGMISAGSSTNYMGSIAGKMSGSSSISGCFSSIGLESQTSGVIAGGLAGIVSGQNNIITDSFFSGYELISGSDTSAGGLIGSSEGLDIRNCYVAGYIDAKTYDVLSALRGSNTVQDNSFYSVSATGVSPNALGASTSEITAEGLGSDKWTKTDGKFPIQNVFINSGSAAGEASAATVIISMNNARSVTSGSVSLSGAELQYIPKDGFTGSIQDENGIIFDENSRFTKFNKGDMTGLALLRVSNGGYLRDIVINLRCWYDAGQESGEYILNTAQELAEFALMVNGTLSSDNNPNGRHTHEDSAGFNGKTVKLGADIDLSAYTDSLGNQISWIPAGSEASPFKGIFDGCGYTVSGLVINEKLPLAGLFGASALGSVIRDTGVQGKITAGEVAGGLIAKNASGASVDNCFGVVEISGASSAGGLCGENSGNITNSFNFGYLSGSNTVGGIAAANSGTITNSFNTGIIIAAGAVVGGIAGNNNTGVISSCFEASYLSGAAIHVIAPVGGNISGDCFYDDSLLLVNDAEGVSSSVLSNNFVYQLPNGGMSLFTAFSDIAEYAALRLNLKGEKFDQFSEANLNKVLSDGTPVGLSQRPDMFILDSSGSNWSILTNSEGNCFLISSVSGGGIVYNHNYFVTAVPNIAVRYEFDFSELFKKGYKNPNYVEGYSSVSTWTQTGDIRVISTVDDYRAFISYVNGGGQTKGISFVLGASVDMTGVQGIVPVGTKDHQFEGTFDGRGYTVEGLFIDVSGAAAMFGFIGQSGVVGNFVLNNVDVIARKGGGDIYLSAVAAVNSGYVYGVGAVGMITADNLGYSYTTYIGTLAGYNRGKIRGCYFRQGNVAFGINHSSKSSDYSGGMLGKNEGMITGCYIVTDALSKDIKALIGDNGGRTDNVINCYFNVNSGDIPASSLNVKSAFDDVGIDKYYVTESMMKSEEFAEWLSSNIYAGTYSVGTASEFAGGNPQQDEEMVNEGFPFLSVTELVKYDLSRFFNSDGDILLSILNLDTSLSTKYSSFLNGRFSYIDKNTYKFFDYKMFSNFITNYKLRITVGLISDDLDYNITARAYGREASFNTDVVKDSGTGDIRLSSDSKNVIDIDKGKSGDIEIIGTDYSLIYNPNIIVLKIKFSVNDGYYEPWGIFREK